MKRGGGVPIILLARGLVLLASLLAVACGPGDGAGGLSTSVALQAEAPPSGTAVPQDQAPLPTQEQSPSVSQRARFDRITPADGLSSPFVRDILQDRQGYMWFATEGGLNRYDGYEFTIYREDPGDPTSIRFDDVWVLLEDSDGTLWVGGGGGLDRFDRETGTFTHVDTRGQIFALHEDSAGTLWAGFWHGLYGYDRSTNEITHSTQPNPDASGERSARTDSAVVAIGEDH